MCHFKILCKSCGTIIAECRCIKFDKVIKYDICDECKQKAIDAKTVKRIISDDIVWCEHCGCLPDQFVIYHIFDSEVDDDISYCSSCMYAKGDIDETQAKTDDIANLTSYKTFLQKELKQCTKNLAEILGMPLDNEE